MNENVIKLEQELKKYDQLVLNMAYTTLYEYGCQSAKETDVTSWLENNNFFSSEIKKQISEATKIMAKYTAFDVLAFIMLNFSVNGIPKVRELSHSYIEILKSIKNGNTRNHKGEPLDEIATAFDYDVWNLAAMPAFKEEDFSSEENE